MKWQGGSSTRLATRYDITIVLVCFPFSFKHQLSDVQNSLGRHCLAIFHGFEEGCTYQLVSLSVLDSRVQIKPEDCTSALEKGCMHNMDVQI